MSKAIVVTIDGPAGVGKTTLAKRLANDLALAYLDTGAMFRTIASLLGEGGWEKSEDEIRQRLEAVSFQLHGHGAGSKLSVNGWALPADIREEHVGQWASKVATLPVVREALARSQRELSQRYPLVVEGRDMGTVIFPDAPVKFFLTARPEVRAKRRIDQLRAAGQDCDEADILAGIVERDERDANRAVAPLRAATDAVIVDTSELTPNEVLHALIDQALAKLARRDESRQA